MTMTSIRPIQDGWDVPLEDALSGLPAADERAWHPLDDEAPDDDPQADPWTTRLRLQIALTEMDLP